MNDYLKTKELYHFGIKGMKWGIRKEDPQESETNKAAKEKVKRANIVGGLGGAVAGAAAGAAIGYFFNRGRVFVNNGETFVDKYSGDSLAKVKNMYVSLIAGTAYIGAVAGKKIMTSKAKQQNHEDAARRLENHQEEIKPNN